MQPCQPDCGRTGTGDLEDRLQDGWEPSLGMHLDGRKWLQPLCYAYWAWWGARAGRKQGRAGEPRWPQPAHQVTKEDVVQSRNQVLWTCYLLALRVRGNAGPKAGPVLVLMPIPQPQKKPCAFPVETEPCLHKGEPRAPGARYLGSEFVLLFASLCSCWHQQAENGQRKIWASHLGAGHPAHLITSQQPFNTGKVSEKTHRVALGSPLSRR